MEGDVQSEGSIVILDKQFVDIPAFRETPNDTLGRSGPLSDPSHRAYS